MQFDDRDVVVHQEPSRPITTWHGVAEYDEHIGGPDLHQVEKFVYREEEKHSD